MKPQKIYTIHSYNRGELCSSNFVNFCKEHGIKRETNTPYTPQQNGVAARYNHTLMEMARAMMFETNLNYKFWGEVVIFLPTF